MKIFISGASGLVGGQCLKVLSEKHEVIGTHLSFPTPHTHYFNTLELDNPHNFDVLAWAPDIILHCGALTHVDYCESNIEESYLKTVQSTQNLLALSEQCNAQFILLSTDYVFDGASGPYTEEEPTHPINVYGQHKLKAEKLVLQHADKHLILRITNVYGDEIRNKNFVARILSTIQENKPLSLHLPIDQFATPTNAFDIARAIQCLIEDNKSGIYHISGTDFMNRVELAQNVLKYFPEYAYNLTTVKTVDLNQAAKRPLNGGLLSVKFKLEYPRFRFTTLDDYLSSFLTQKKL